MSEFPYPYSVQLPDAKIPPLEARRAPSPKQLCVILAVLTACFALINITVIPASNRQIEPRLREFWQAFSFGIIGAQAGLLAIAAVLGPGKGLLRHLIAVPLALGLVLAWLLGYGLAKWTHSTPQFFPEWNEILPQILVIPVMFCACELPLWIFRGLLRWRMELAVPDTSRRRPPHLSIAGILMATGAVAVALASARLGRSFVAANFSEPDWWGACGIAVAFSGGISLVTLPLSTWATLRCPSLVAGIVAMVAWLISAALLLICIISVLVGDWPPMELEFWLPFSGLIFSFGFGLLGTLSLIRAAGYRLFWGREETQLSVATSAGPSEVPASPKP